MNSTAQQVYYANMASNVQWVASSYPLRSVPFPYNYPSSSLAMMTPQSQGYNYYLPYGQFCSPYIQNVQQYQYSMAKASEGVYNRANIHYGSVYTTYQYQPYGASAMMNPVQHREAPQAQWKAPPTPPKRIVIRDPNQGGRDITEEIMSGLYHENKHAQDHESHPVTSIRPMESVDGNLAPTSSPPSAPPSVRELSGSRGSVDVPVTEEEKKEDEEPETKNTEMLLTCDQDSVNDSVLNVAPNESASFESLSGSTPNEVPGENVTFGTGKADGEVTPNLVPLATTASGPVEQQGCLSNDLLHEEERIKKIIDLTVERVTSEPNFSVTCATMCYQMKELKEPTLEKLLLSRCQEELKKEKKHDRDLTKKQKELEAATENNWELRIKNQDTETSNEVHKEDKKEEQKDLKERTPVQQSVPLKKDIIKGTGGQQGSFRFPFKNQTVRPSHQNNINKNNWELRTKNQDTETSNEVHKEDKNEDQKDQKNLKERTPVQQSVPSKKDIIKGTGGQQGSFRFPFKNQTVRLSHQNNINKNNWEPRTKNQDAETSNEVHKENKKEEQKDLKERTPVQQRVPSKKDIIRGTEGREVQRQQGGFRFPFKNQTVRPSHQNNINKPGALNCNQLDAPGKSSSWQKEQEGGRRINAENDGAAYFRRSWECQDRRYRGQDIYPCPYIEEH
ncbi:eukaryotic translation initiation factor 4 gamma 1-like [Trichomycterus rosablanca]|uniref:eukaryotic translation initiation factor 4 gamma 1-like n=1 Tax=Trichomycterus rosablanca TaxID=2290929 RepID=UPI002F35F1ED